MQTLQGGAKLEIEVVKLPVTPWIFLLRSHKCYHWNILWKCRIEKPRMNCFFSIQHVHTHSHTLRQGLHYARQLFHSLHWSLLRSRTLQLLFFWSSLRPSVSTRPVLTPPVCSSVMKRCFKNCLKSYFTVGFRGLGWVCVYLSVEHILYEGRFPDGTSHVCPLCFYHIFSFRSLEYIRKHNKWVRLHKTVSHTVWAVCFFSWNLLIQLSKINLATSQESVTSLCKLSCKRSSLIWKRKTQNIT